MAEVVGMLGTMSLAVIGVAAGLALQAATRGGAQGVVGVDAHESGRFDVVARALVRAGYSTVTTIGHGQTPETDRVFAFLATHAGKDVVVAATEAAGDIVSRPADLESDATPAAIGVRGVDFQPFRVIAGADLIDVIIPGGFTVTTVDETIEREGQAASSAPRTTARAVTTVRYDLPATGSCVARR